MSRSAATSGDEKIASARFAVNDRVKVLTAEGREVGRGNDEVGMVAVGGRIPLGYYNDPEKTAQTFKVIVGVRYSIPGDYATVDEDGTFRLLGRGSSTVNTGGEKVYPEEVELTLRKNKESRLRRPRRPDELRRDVCAGAGHRRLLHRRSRAAGVLRQPGPGYKVPPDPFTDTLRRAPNGRPTTSSCGRWRQTCSAPPEADVADHFVIDGSNLATEGRTEPSLAQLKEAVAAFHAEHPGAVATLVVDASFEHRIDPSERDAFAKSEAAGEVVSPPAGAVGRGDGFLLQIADRTGGTVISNDSFQEFHAEYEWLFEPGRLIGGKPVPGVGWIFSLRRPVRGIVSRKTVQKSKQEGKAEKQVQKAIAEATASAMQPDAPKRRRRRGGRGRGSASKDDNKAEPEAVNEPASFLQFVIDHRLGTEVEGTVEAFASRRVRQRRQRAVLRAAQCDGEQTSARLSRRADQGRPHVRRPGGRRCAASSWGCPASIAGAER